MNLLLDTNIALGIIRAKDYPGILNLINPENSIKYISLVSEAELKSLALRNKWGIKRLISLNDFLDEVHIIEINRSHPTIYAEIDAYSQRLNPSFEDYGFDTPRNMGKNDLWIASLAALLGLKLVTTDSDFDHLHNVFFEVRKINPEEFLQFF
jgi:tRNA(fMet)-specific endonuclease VapC